MPTVVAPKPASRKEPAPAVSHADRGSVGAPLGMPLFLQPAPCGATAVESPGVQARSGPGQVTAGGETPSLLRPGGESTRTPDLIHQESRRSLADANRPLPHAPRIQAAFGHHDVSSVRVAVGGEAGSAARRLGALAFTSGTRIGFRDNPDVRLAAHEAAHTVQQRAGLRLPDAVGRPGDRWEQHADQVAEAVVEGRSAEQLLDRVAGPGRAADPGTVLQRQVAGGDGADVDTEPAASPLARYVVLREALSPDAWGRLETAAREREGIVRRRNGQPLRSEGSRPPGRGTTELTVPLDDLLYPRLDPGDAPGVDWKRRLVEVLRLGGGEGERRAARTVGDEMLRRWRSESGTFLATPVRVALVDPRGSSDSVTELVFLLGERPIETRNGALYPMQIDSSGFTRVREALQSEAAPLEPMLRLDARAQEALRIGRSLTGAAHVEVARQAILDLRATLRALAGQIQEFRSLQPDLAYLADPVHASVEDFDRGTLAGFLEEHLRFERENPRPQSFGELMEESADSYRGRPEQGQILASYGLVNIFTGGAPIESAQFHRMWRAGQISLRALDEAVDRTIERGSISGGLNGAFLLAGMLFTGPLGGASLLGRMLASGAMGGAGTFAVMWAESAYTREHPLGDPATQAIWAERQWTGEQILTQSALSFAVGAALPLAGRMLGRLMRMVDPRGLQRIAQQSLTSEPLSLPPGLRGQRIRPGLVRIHVEGEVGHVDVTPDGYRVFGPAGREGVLRPIASGSWGELPPVRSPDGPPLGYGMGGPVRTSAQTPLGFLVNEQGGVVLSPQTIPRAGRWDWGMPGPGQLPPGTPLLPPPAPLLPGSPGAVGGPTLGGAGLPRLPSGPVPGAVLGPGAATPALPAGPIAPAAQPPFVVLVVPFQRSVRFGPPQTDYAVIAVPTGGTPGPGVGPPGSSASPGIPSMAGGPRGGPPGIGSALGPAPVGGGMGPWRPSGSGLYLPEEPRIVLPTGPGGTVLARPLPLVVPPEPGIVVPPGGAALGFPAGSPTLTPFAPDPWPAPGTPAAPGTAPPFPWGGGFPNPLFPGLLPRPMDPLAPRLSPLQDLLSVDALNRRAAASALVATLPPQVQARQEWDVITYRWGSTGAVRRALRGVVGVMVSNPVLQGERTLLAATLGNVTVQLAERPYQIQVTEDHPDVVALFAELRIDGDLARRQALQWLDQEIFAHPDWADDAVSRAVDFVRGRLVADRRTGRRTAEASLEGLGSLGGVGRDSPHLVSVADRLVRGGILRSGAWRSARNPGQQAGVVGEALATEQFRRTTAPGRRVMTRMLVRGDAYRNPTGPELAQMSDGTPMRRATLAEADLAEIETTPEGRHVVHRLGSVKAGASGAAEARSANREIRNVLSALGTRGRVPIELKDGSTVYCDLATVSVTAETEVGEAVTLGHPGASTPAGTTLETYGHGGRFDQQLPHPRRDVDGIARLVRSMELLQLGTYR